MFLNKKLAALLIGLLAFTQQSWAEPLDDLVQLFAFKQYQAEFKQVTFDQNEAPLQKLEGHIVIERPDHFFWQSGEPYPQKLISNGKTIWHYDEDLDQVVIQEYNKQAENTPLLMILKNSENLKTNFKLLDYAENKGMKVFHLQLLNENSHIEQVMIAFAEQQLVQLRFIDNLKQATDIRFGKVVLNQAVEASLFNFTPPESADILHE